MDLSEPHFLVVLRNNFAAVIFALIVQGAVFCAWSFPSRLRAVAALRGAPGHFNRCLRRAAPRSCPAAPTPSPPQRAPSVGSLPAATPRLPSCPPQGRAPLGSVPGRGGRGPCHARVAAARSARSATGSPAGCGSQEDKKRLCERVRVAGCAEPPQRPGG